MSSHGKWDDCDIIFKIMVIIKQGRFKCIECMNKENELYDVSTYCTKLLNMTPFNIKLKVLATSN
jgi:hypothetical protein